MPAEKKVGLIAGVFDMVHAGHVLALRDAKAQCDHLIVALHVAPTDSSKNQPVMSLAEREIILSGSRYVDEVVCYRTERDLKKLLSERDVDIRFLGDDYRSRPIIGASLSTEVRFLSRSQHCWSSRELRARVYAAEIERRMKGAA